MITRFIFSRSVNILIVKLTRDQSYRYALGHYLLDTRTLIVQTHAIVYNLSTCRACINGEESTLTKPRTVLELL